MQPGIFTASHWEILMFWYATFTCICGGLLLLNVVKSGFRYSQSALNPGVRVSFIEDIQRAALAMGLIAIAPLLVTLLMNINDGFVALCGLTLTHFVTDPVLENEFSLERADMFQAILASPINLLINIFNSLFGLKGLDDLVFNGSTDVFGDWFRSINTGNVLANMVMDSSMMVFNVYFNAVYEIRRWMITAAIAAAPLVTWIWVLTAQRAVLEVFLAEIIQSIFMQSSHALTLSIFFSVVGGTARDPGMKNAAELSGGLVQIGIFFAALAGSVLVAVLVILGLRMMTTEGEKERAEAKAGIKKALIGLIILGLCTLIASYIASLLSGNWGVPWS